MILQTQEVIIRSSENSNSMPHNAYDAINIGKNYEDNFDENTLLVILT